MPTYSEVGDQHDFSVVEPPDPSRACEEKGLATYVRLLESTQNASIEQSL